MATDALSPGDQARGSWRSPCLDRPVRLAVLVSGGGTTLENLARRIEANMLSAEIAQVLVSREGVGGIDVAHRHRLPCQVVPRKRYDSPPDFSEAVFDAILNANADLVCLAGFLCLLKIPDDFRHRVLNIHPSLLPSFGGPGMYGRRVHAAVLDAGAKLSGCTVHFADDTYDTGPIVTQRACPVLPDDTPESLADRVFAEECVAFPEAIDAWAQGRIHVQAHRTRVDARSSHLSAKTKS